MSSERKIGMTATIFPEPRPPEERTPKFSEAGFIMKQNLKRLLAKLEKARFAGELRHYLLASDFFAIVLLS